MGISAGMGRGRDEWPDCLGPGRGGGVAVRMGSPIDEVWEGTGVRTWVFIMSGVSLGSPGQHWASLSLSVKCRAG